MIERLRHWRRMYLGRGAATLPFWMWLKWVLRGSQKP